MTNSVDIDQTPCPVAPDLGVHCLLVPVCPSTYCPFDISRKRCFLFGVFVLNEDTCILFLLTASYQKPFVFSDSVFSSQIFTVKLNLRPKNGLTYANSIVK